MTWSSRTAGPPGTYFDLLTPAEPSDRPPVVLVHGGAHTGSCYLATADGRPGWAHGLVQRGYAVAMPDWPGIGRSGYVAPEALTGELVCAGLARVIDALGTPAVVVTHSMGGAYGWRLLERCGPAIAALVAVAPGPPGNIQPIAAIAEQTATHLRIVGTTNYTLERHAPFAPPRGFVLSKLAGDGWRFPREALDRYAESLIAIPPRLVQERLNVGGSQMRVEDFASYRGKPVLVLTGTHDVDHTREADRQVVDWLVATGAAAEHCYLGDLGIEGNGHMLMLEQNSDELLELVCGWIGKVLPVTASPLSSQ